MYFNTFWKCFSYFILQSLILVESESSDVEIITRYRHTQPAWYLQAKWLLLQFGHNAPSLLASLETMLLELEPMHPEFRCWVAALADHTRVPIRLLQISHRVQVDSPKVSCLLRFFISLDAPAVGGHQDELN